jgi:hypothetical protein
LGSEPNVVEQPQKIFEFVKSCAWISSPITDSYFIDFLYQFPLLAKPSRRDPEGDRGGFSLIVKSPLPAGRQACPSFIKRGIFL